jgi:hypothetical protein
VHGISVRSGGSFVIKATSNVNRQIAVLLSLLNVLMDCNQMSPLAFCVSVFAMLCDSD